MKPRKRVLYAFDSVCDDHCNPFDTYYTGLNILSPSMPCSIFKGVENIEARKVHLIKYPKHRSFGVKRGVSPPHVKQEVSPRHDQFAHDRSPQTKLFEQSAFSSSSKRFLASPDMQYFFLLELGPIFYVKLLMRELSMHSLDFLSRLHIIQPLSYQRVPIDFQFRQLVFLHPRVKVDINRTVPAFQYALPIRLLQLTLQHRITSVGLLFVASEGILVLGWVVMPVPIHLTHHRAKGAHEEVDPLLVVDHDLIRGGGGGIEAVLGIIFSEEVGDYGTRFPGHYAGVGVLCQVLV